MGKSKKLDIEKMISEVIVEVSGCKDVGRSDSRVKEDIIQITKGYKQFLDDNNGKDTDIFFIMLGNEYYFASGKFAVQEIIKVSANLVKLLIREGVPKKVALKLLPWEIYEELKEERKI